MKVQRKRSGRGFTLVELVIGMALTLIVAGAAVYMLDHLMTSVAITTERAEIQANARAGVNQISQDLGQAGAGGFPWGGISLPSGAGSGNVLFAHDVNGVDYLTGNSFQNDEANPPSGARLYAVTPAYKLGPPNPFASPAVNTDGIVITYIDPTLNWTAYPTQQPTAISATGNSVTMPDGTTPAVNDPVQGLQPGDVMMLQNTNGAALGLVTKISGNQISFDAGDALGLNQIGAATGNIAALATSPGNYPPTTVFRVLMVSYFVEPLDASGNVLPPNTASAADYRLMRQINAQPPVPIAEHVVNLKFAYDLSDPNTSEQSSNVPDAQAGTPAAPAFSEIRNVYVAVTARSNAPDPTTGRYNYVSLYTNVSPRNLSFHDTYN
jgi:prepilin-type N-terminal cleavage/methylation domain-containing protein